MADCLYDCLKEAGLEHCYKKFTSRGLTTCDALAQLSKDKYQQYGIESTDDRLKLFELIQIVKSLEGDRLYQCGKAYSNRNKAAQPPKPDKNIIKDNGLHANNKTAVYVKVPHIVPKKAQAVKGLKEEDINVKPRAKPNEKQKYVPAHKGVVFNKLTDSPVFQCKRTLNFSDLDSDDDTPSSSAKKSKTRNVLESPQEEIDFEPNLHFSAPAQKVPRSFFIPVESPRKSPQKPLTCKADSASASQHPYNNTGVPEGNTQPVIKEQLEQRHSELHSRAQPIYKEKLTQPHQRGFTDQPAKQYTSADTGSRTTVTSVTTSISTASASANNKTTINTSRTHSTAIQAERNTTSNRNYATSAEKSTRGNTPEKFV